MFAADMTSDEDDDDRSSSHDEPPTMAETRLFLALDVLSRAVVGENVHKIACTELYTFQKSIVEDVSKKKMQINIRNFFSQKQIYVCFILCMF